MENNEEKKGAINDEKTVEDKPETLTVPRMRRLVIETDGNKIRIAANELTGMLELKAVLTELLTNIR
jgi:hypothetical protein